ncbi:MAG: tetratricopeptide repeat protein [Bryobacteraceae bacterium]
MTTSRIQHLWALLFLGSALVCASPLRPVTVVVVQFHNTSAYSDLNWVGESIAETLMDEFQANNQIVLGRNSRAAAMHRLSLRPGSEFTKATLIRLGQALDADYLCYGDYDAKLSSGSAELKDSSVQVSARFIDLRKMHEGPEISEAGKLADLSKLEEHLAWQSLKYLQPGATAQLDQFITPGKLIRVDAEESYIRGLLSSNREQQQKWFSQAAALDPQFSSPGFELAKLALERKDYRQAISWFQHIPSNDPRYPEARFRMGLSAYGSGDYRSAANYFREAATAFPLNEVYNNLGAAEDRLNLPVAIDDFRRALDGDQNDPTYLFNLGAALLKNNYFDEAAKRLQAVIDRNADDSEARALLDRAQRREPIEAPNERLKQNFDETAFRQLKAMLAK